MVSQTNELALEAAIEQALTGLTTEAVNQAGTIRETPAHDLVANNGFRLGLPTDFNPQYALDEEFFWRFLEQTQEQELAKLKSKRPANPPCQAEVGVQLCGRSSSMALFLCVGNRVSTSFR